MNTIYRTLLLSFLFLFFASVGKAESVKYVTVSDRFSLQIKKEAYYLIDKTNKLNINDIVNNKNFNENENKVLNFGNTENNVWIKISLYNPTQSTEFLIEIENALLDEVKLFYPTINGYATQTASKLIPFNLREIKSATPHFKINIAQGERKTIYLKIKSNTQVIVPLKVGTGQHIILYDIKKNILIGVYFGIILSLVLYNLFIYGSLFEISYFYYILYLLSVALVQLNVTGWGFKYVWLKFPEFENFSVYLFPALTAFTAIAFTKKFLNLKQHSPKFNLILNVITVLYIINLCIAYWGDKRISYELINVFGLLLSLSLIWIGIDLWFNDKYRPGLFFLIAWSFFLFSVIGFVLKDYDVLPYNLFTASLLQIGSASVGILLSIALVDKINILQEETRKSQKLALMAAQENERILSEQNVLLDQQVKARTQELSDANASLEQTLIDLKEAEAQLVESEKMSSLGQLTAGIAHEINNPINFVTSNVKPLKRDIEIIRELLGKVETVALSTDSQEEKQKQVAALKEEADLDYLSMEMDHLLKGIGEGASRTAEIVKGLRVFSRLDEDDLKLADLNEGMESTLVIVNNLLNGKITLEKNYAELPLAECYPGKLNQVFLNLITNAIHAIKERWKDEPGGQLKVATVATPHDINIHIQDNGTGMTETTKKKLFEPFFTTKDVGVGTGLGLSIVWNTIKKHNGQIQVNSEEGVGTEFVITIPIKYTEPQND